MLRTRRVVKDTIKRVRIVKDDAGVRMWRLIAEALPRFGLALSVVAIIAGALVAIAFDNNNLINVWNLVEQWSDFFGVPLVETRRGKGTTLTAFGEKLVWAGEITCVFDMQPEDELADLKSSNARSRLR
jgi:hypothetical protein